MWAQEGSVAQNFRSTEWLIDTMSNLVNKAQLVQSNCVAHYVLECSFLLLSKAQVLSLSISYWLVKFTTSTNKDSVWYVELPLQYACLRSLATCPLTTNPEHTLINFSPLYAKGSTTTSIGWISSVTVQLACLILVVSKSFLNLVLPYFPAIT